VRSYFVLMCLLISFSAFADQLSILEVVPLNSPVKGSLARFSLKLPPGFEVDKVKVKLVNANDLNQDQKNFEEIKILNTNQLIMGISKLPPGFYRLYVKVWDKKNKAEHDFKTKFHDFVRFVIDESKQVPMPDSKKNAATIAGIDSDNDGIRDDIQRFINENYVQEVKTLMAVKQIARAMQLDLLSVNDKDVSILAGRKMLNSNDCLAFILGTRNKAVIRKKIEGQLHNTKNRLYANIKANENFSGQSYELPGTLEEEKATCDFNPDNF
jgi:hypothetical protein